MANLRTNYGGLVSADREFKGVKRKTQCTLCKHGKDLRCFEKVADPISVTFCLIKPSVITSRASELTLA
jgi:hypothetical protein